jgi:hypothetical protein
MLFRREIIEERSFAHVGFFGDVFHCRFEKTALGKKAQRSAVEALADLLAMPFAAICPGRGD